MAFRHAAVAARSNCIHHYLEEIITTHAFTGIVPPIVTPYTEGGDLDFVSLTRLIESLLAGGVHGLFALGSSGEAAFLSDDQRAQVLTHVVSTAAGHVPVFAGINDMTINRVINQARIAEGAGVDALVVTAPFYILPSSAEVEAHFRAVAAETDLPIFAYDVPVRVHRKLECDMLIRLGLDGVIVGVKDSSGDDVGFRRLVAANRNAGSPLKLFTGHEVVVDGALMAGADGVVPGLGNVDPRGYVRLYEAARGGHWESVRSEQNRLAELFEIVFQAKDVSGEAAGLGAFKTALQILGVLDTNVMSRPIPRLFGDSVERIRPILEQAGLLAR